MLIPHRLHYEFIAHDQRRGSILIAQIARLVALSMADLCDRGAGIMANLLEDAPDPI
jgi:hypothetical protein